MKNMNNKFSKKIYFFVGTTTELIKLAPIIRELEQRKIAFKVITSGQTKVKFEELSQIIKKKKADIALGEKNNRSSVSRFFVWFLLTFVRAFSLRKEFRGLNKNKAMIIVHGDPVSSFIGAIIAKFFGLTLVHIESGLRSFNYMEPFPEEITRQIISKLADIHFPPNDWALKNLSNTGGKKINTLSNTLIESYQLVTRHRKTFNTELSTKIKKYFVLIMHRQEHVIFGKDSSEKIFHFVLKNVQKDISCVFVTHALASEFLEMLKGGLTAEESQKLHFVSRLSYVNFVNLLENAEFIVTDGGSNQEEAFYMGLPCLLLRNYTERIEGLGENVVLGAGNKKIIKLFLQNYKKYRKKKVVMKVRPSNIIVDSLLSQ